MDMFDATAAALRLDEAAPHPPVPCQEGRPMRRWPIRHAQYCAQTAAAAAERASLSNGRQTSRAAVLSACPGRAASGNPRRNQAAAARVALDGGGALCTGKSCSISGAYSRQEEKLAR